MISNKKILGNGINKRFLSDFIIKSEQNVRVFNYVFDPINGSDTSNILDTNTGLYLRKTDIPTSDDLVSLDKWDLVNNSILFYSVPKNNVTIYLEVATTPEEFGGTINLPAVELSDIAKEAAETAANEAQNILTELKLYYMGAYAENPEINMVEGSMYFNTVYKYIYIYDGNNWLSLTSMIETTIKREIFTVSTDTTNFVLSNNFDINQNELTIVINGITQESNTYIENNDNSITLSEPLTSEDSMEITITQNIALNKENIIEYIDNGDLNTITNIKSNDFIPILENLNIGNNTNVWEYGYINSILTYDINGIGNTISGDLTGNMFSQSCISRFARSVNIASIYSEATGNSTANIASRLCRTNVAESVNIGSEECDSLGETRGSNLSSIYSWSSGNCSNNTASRRGRVSAPESINIASNTCLAGDGYGAELECIFTNGAITGINIISGGNDYINNPTLEVLDKSGSGSGGSLTAVVNNGSITNVNIENSGSGYNEDTDETVIKIYNTDLRLSNISSYNSTVRGNDSTNIASTGSNIQGNKIANIASENPITKGEILANITSSGSIITGLRGTIINSKNAEIAQNYLLGGGYSDNSITETGSNQNLNWSFNSKNGDGFVNGFMGLGDLSPQIKIKKITGITGANQGDTSTVLHNLEGNKIISYTVKVIHTDHEGIGPEFSAINGYQFSVYHNGYNFNVINSNTNSNNILSKDFIIYVTYEK